MDNGTASMALSGPKVVAMMTEPLYGPGINEQLTNSSTAQRTEKEARGRIEP